MKKIVVGLAALVSVGALAACSAANASPATNHSKVVAAGTPAKSIVDTTTSSAPTTTAAPTTTTAPSTTKKATPPAPAQPPAAQAPVAQVPAAPAAGAPPCSASAKACVDLATRKAWLVQNGQVVYGPVSIMPGRPGFRTPSGTFHVLSKNAHYWSREFNAVMPDSVFFYPGDAFHIGSLSVMSHGCIHLSPSAAATFFSTLQIGDEVQVMQG